MAVDVADLRALVLDEDENVFADEALEAAISASGGNILRAASFAFASLAAVYAALGKSIRTDDLGLDTKGRGGDLLAVSRYFAAQADALDEAASSDFFQIVPLAGRRDHAVRVEGSPWPLPSCPTPTSSGAGYGNGGYGG